MPCLVCLVVLSLVNAQRAHPLTYSSTLERLAQTPGHLLARAHRRCNAPQVAENTTWGTRRLGTPQAAVQAWMDSPPHRAIMLDPRYHYTGISVRHSGPWTIYTEDFASSCRAP